MNSICPDCKGDIELETVNTYIGNSEFNVHESDKFWYKCPKCKQEFESEDIEE